VPALPPGYGPRMAFPQPSRRRALVLAALAAVVPMPSIADPLDAAAERYVKLVLAVGRHAPDYVDAYFGPPEWKAEAEQGEPRPLPGLSAEAAALLALVRGAPGEGRRRDFLLGQLGAVRTYLELLGGKKLPFDEEARALFGVATPQVDLGRLEALRDRLEALLPGPGPIAERYQAWRGRFAIPRDRLLPVLELAIAESRRRTLAHLPLPEGERFTFALVEGKPWGAYNWYRGNAVSLIEVSADLPVYISSAIGLSAHEGYPGHHAFNCLQEEVLARRGRRLEHTVYPLHSPISLVAEGSAEAGVEVAFPDKERLDFERRVLFPAAGLDPAEAARYAEVRRLIKELGYAEIELARRYLDGQTAAADVKAWLSAYGLKSAAEAERMLRFFDRYRSYVINYRYGEEIVTAWLEARAGADRRARWEALGDLLSSPRLPAALVARPAR